MRALVLEVDERLLEERRRRGIDCFDEMWEGLLHMVPPPSGEHQRIETGLGEVLGPITRERGWWISNETGLYRAHDDYRIPDVMVYRPEAASKRGVDGAPEVLIEICSPGDESREKIPWYLARGCGEVIIIDREAGSIEIHTAEGMVPADPDGWVPSGALGVRLRAAEGGRLTVETPGGATTLP